MINTAFSNLKFVFYYLFKVSAKHTLSCYGKWLTWNNSFANIKIRSKLNNIQYLKGTKSLKVFVFSPRIYWLNISDNCVIPMQRYWSYPPGSKWYVVMM